MSTVPSEAVWSLSGAVTYSLVPRISLSRIGPWLRKVQNQVLTLRFPRHLHAQHFSDNAVEVHWHLLRQGEMRVRFPASDGNSEEVSG
jgi:hypothetical protein